MAEVTGTIDFKALLGDLTTYKYDPNRIQTAYLNHLSKAVNGEIDIVDPSNPFIYLLGICATSTSAAITENVLNLRKRFPSLSQSYSDLYEHMCDEDYTDRFSVPSSCNFTMMINLSDINKRMVLDKVENCYKVTIPKNTSIVISGIDFTFSYPITIRKRTNGAISVSYDTSEQSPVTTVPTNIIDYDIRKNLDDSSWLFFNLNLFQYNIKTTEFSVNKTSLFKETIPFNDKFYLVRIYQKNKLNNSKWTEFSVTHSDQVYDPFVATASVKVLDNSLTVTIPIVYLMNNIVSGSLKIEIYTTKGALMFNMADYKMSSYMISYSSTERLTVTDAYTDAIKNIGMFAFSTDKVNSGSNGLSFEELRKRVINNSVGTNSAPITNLQIESYTNDKGFDLLKNVDTLTNRIFLAVKKLPYSSNQRIFTPANISIETVIMDADKLNSDFIIINGKRTTIKSNALIRKYNDSSSFFTSLDSSYVSSLSKKDLISYLNNKTSKTLYTPFYYVVDENNDILKVNTYNLDNPSVLRKSFREQNQTNQLSVSTINYKIEKVFNGYKLILKTKSDTYFQQLPDSKITCQLAFTPVNDNRLVFLNGVLLTDTPESREKIFGERIYEILIMTNHDIIGDEIVITNAKYGNGSQLPINTLLTNNYYIVYGTQSISTTFKQSSIDSYIGAYSTPVGTVGVTLEDITIKLGSLLTGIYNAARYLPTETKYLTYSEDVPSIYLEDVFEIDAITGSIYKLDSSGNLTTTKIHSKGDYVLDVNGNNVLLHKKGEVLKDSGGNPIPESQTIKLLKEINLLVIDSKYLYADDADMISYRKEITETIESWCNLDIMDIQNKLLEQTKIFYHPPTNTSTVLISHNGIDYRISSEQPVIVDLYVKNRIYKDLSIVQSMKENINKYLDWYFSRYDSINIIEIEKNIMEQNKGVLESISLKNLFDGNDFKYIACKNSKNRLSIEKKIEQTLTGDLTVLDNITFNLIKVD